MSLKDYVLAQEAKRRSGTAGAASDGDDGYNSATQRGGLADIIREQERQRLAKEQERLEEERRQRREKEQRERAEIEAQASELASKLKGKSARDVVGAVVDNIKDKLDTARGAIVSNAAQNFLKTSEKLPVLNKAVKQFTEPVDEETAKIYKGYSELMNIKPDANSADPEMRRGNSASIFRATYKQRGYTTDEANAILHLAGESVYGPLAQLRLWNNDKYAYVKVAKDKVPEGAVVVRDGDNGTVYIKNPAHLDYKSRLEKYGLTEKDLETEINTLVYIGGQIEGAGGRKNKNWDVARDKLTVKSHRPDDNYEVHEYRFAGDKDGSGLSQKSLSLLRKALKNDGTIGDTYLGTGKAKPNEDIQLEDFEKQISEEEYNAAVNMFAAGKIDKLNEWVELMWGKWTNEQAQQNYEKTKNYGPFRKFLYKAWNAAETASDQVGQGIAGWFADEENTIAPTVNQYESAYIHEDNSGVQNFIYDAFQNTLAMAPSMLLSYLTGKGASTAGASPEVATKISGTVNALSIGIGAGGNARNSALREGYSESEATMYGLLSGASEACLEKLLAPAMFGGGVTGKWADNAIAKINNSLLRVSARVGRSMFNEFSEEYLQEVLEPVFRNICLDENNEFKPFTEEALYSGMLGAVTGGLIDAPHIIKTERAVASIGKIADVETLTGEAEKLGGEAAKYAAKLGKNPSNAQKGRLAVTVSDARIETAQKNIDADTSLSDGAKKLLKKTVDGTITVKDAALINEPGAREAFENLIGDSVPEDAVARDVASAALGYYEANMAPYAISKPMLYNKRLNAQLDSEAAENVTNPAETSPSEAITVGADTETVNSDGAVALPAETEATAVQLPAEPAQEGDDNAITVKRAKASAPQKAVSRIAKTSSAAESGGRYYIYDNKSVVRFDESPANIEYNTEDARVSQLDRILERAGDGTGIVFTSDTAADLKTAINAVKRIKTAYGDKGADVLYHFGDGIVLDAAAVLNIAEALPNAQISRVPVSSGFYALRFDAPVGVGLVMPLRYNSVNAAENSVFLGNGKNAPASAFVTLGQNSWAPAEGEAAIPSKRSDRVFNDNLEFDFGEETLTDRAESDILSDDKARKKFAVDFTGFVYDIFDVELSNSEKRAISSAIKTGKANNHVNNSATKGYVRVGDYGYTYIIVNDSVQVTNRIDLDNDVLRAITGGTYYEQSDSIQREVGSGNRGTANESIFDVESSRGVEERRTNTPPSRNKEGTLENDGEVSFRKSKSDADGNRQSSRENSADEDLAEKRAETSPPSESAVEKREGENVFIAEDGTKRTVREVDEDGDVVLEDGSTLNVDALDPEARSAVDTVLADLYSGRITESEAHSMLKNGTLIYVKDESAWITDNLNDGNKAEVMSPQQIERLAEHLFGVYINYGRIGSRNALGFMYAGQRGVRTRTAGMLPTACHELGHIFDLTDGKKLQKLPGIDEVIRQAPQAWLNNYPARQRAGEAVAWFTENYFRSRKDAQQISPTFFRQFEAAFNKGELAKLHEFGDAVNRFMVRETDADGNDITVLKQQRAQLATQMKAAPDMRSVAERAKDSARRAEANWFNANALFEKNVGDDAAVLYNSVIISGAARATHMISGNDSLIPGTKKHFGGFDTADGRHINDLKTILSPLDPLISKSKDAYADFNTYLTLRRGGYKVVEGKRVYASDTANNPEVIANNIKLLEAKYPTFRKIADEAIEFHRELTKKMCVDTGLISREAYEKMAADDPFYVPFRRNIDSASGVTTGAPLKSEKRFKRMKGSGRDIYNPVESLFTDAYETVISSMRAQYGDYIINKIDADPAEWEWLGTRVKVNTRLDVTDISKQRDSFRDALLAAGLNDAQANAIMTVFDGTVGDEVKSFRVPYYQGEDFFLRRRWSTDPVTGEEVSTLTCYQFNDEYARDILKNAIDNSVNVSSKAMRGLLSLSHFRKVFLTGSSPLFTVRNLVRDAQDAYAYSGINNPVKFAAEYTKALKSVLAADSDYASYKAVGGGNSTRISADVKTVADLVPTIYKANTGRAVRIMRDIVRAPAQFIERTNEAIEQVPRLMEFKHRISEGETVEQALYAANNITVNFGQHGAQQGLITTMGGLFPFFNAGLQGRYRLYQALKTNPATFLAKKSITALVRVGALYGLIKAFGAEDEYKKLSNYIKNNNYVIPIGKDVFLRLPKDREGGILDSLIENSVSSLMFGPNSEQWYDYATYLMEQVGGPGTLESMLGSLIETLHDGGTVGIDQFADILGDTVASPFLDLIRNEDYRGIKIETSTDQKLPVSERYNENTSAIAKFIGKSGVISPKKVQHFIDALGFIPSALIAMPENFTEGGLLGPLKAVGESFKSAFSSSAVYSNDAVNEFYDTIDRLEKEKNARNTGKNRSEYARADATRTVMSELYAMRRAADEAERKAITRIIRDTAYEYLNADPKDDYVSKELSELYDRLGNDADYSAIFYTAPKHEIHDGGITFTLSLPDYLSYADDYRAAVRNAYSSVLGSNYSDDTELAKALIDAKNEAGAALKKKYMLFGNASSSEITTNLIRAKLENESEGNVAATLKTYVAQERRNSRKDDGIRTSVANIFRDYYVAAKAAGDEKTAKWTEEMLLGLNIGFKKETIRGWYKNKGKR